jgi:predicted dehydrogenase
MLADASEPIRVALIGFGLGGEVFHAPLVQADPDLALVTIVTNDPSRRARAAARYPEARVVERADAVWDRADDHDLVIVCTPNVAHVRLATAGLDAGLAVVVDKPLAASSADGRALAGLAAERGLLLSVFQNRRWDGDFLTVRRLIADGSLGDSARGSSGGGRRATTAGASAGPRTRPAACSGTSAATWSTRPSGSSGGPRPSTPRWTCAGQGWRPTTTSSSR